MAITSTSIFAGADSLWISYINSAGLISGFSNISSNGQSSGLRRVKGVTNVPNPILEPNKIAIPGDDGRLGTFQMVNTDIASGNVEVSVADFTLEAAVQGSTVWTLGDFGFGVRGVSNPTFPTMALLVISQAKSQDSGNFGEAGFMHRLYPNCQLMPLGEESAAHQAPGSVRYAVAINPFTIVPWGLSLMSNLGSSDGLSINWWSKYRTLMHAILFGGSTPDIVVDYTPVSTTYTKVYLTASGVTSAGTLTSVTPGTKTITLNSNPTAATLGIALFGVSSLS